MKIRILAIVLLVSVLMTAFASVTFAAEEKGTGLYKEGDQWKYYENGSFKKVTGMVKKANANTWHYVENGVYKKATGMVKCVQPNCSSTGKWYYVEKGDQAKVTGLVQSVQPGSSQGKWYYVVDGKQNKKATGMVKCVQPGSPQEGEWFYVVKGKLSKESGMVKCIQPNCSSTGKWYLVIKGKYTKETGLAPCIQPGDSKGKVYYLKEGKLYRKTGRVTDRCVNIKLKRGRAVSFSANKKAVKEVTFPTLSSLGIKGRSSTLDAKIDKKLREIIEMHAKEGYNFEDMPDTCKARNIILYFNKYYPYAENGSYNVENMLDKGSGNCYAFSDTIYCMLKKIGISEVYLTVVGRYPYRPYHRSTVFKIGKNYYMADSMKISHDREYTLETLASDIDMDLSKMPKKWAKYLIGKTNKKPND